MKTKFIYVIMAVLLMGSQMTLSAQNTDNKQKKQRPTPEQMVQMQTKQIVNTLMLDDATAAKFTPVYEKYLKELRECRMMTHKARTEKTKAQGTDANAKKERPSMTDDEIATMLRNQFTQSRKMLDIREKFLQHQASSGAVYATTHTYQYSLISFFHSNFENLHGYKCTRFQREKLLF